MKSSLSRPNRSTDALHAYRPAPVSAIISTNSGIDGMSSLLDLVLHVVRHHAWPCRGSRRARSRRCRPGIADGRELDVLVALLVDHVEAEEREEQVRLDALGARAVRHDQARVHAFERALADDDRHLLDRCVAHALVLPSRRRVRCSRAASGCRRSSRRPWPGLSGTARTAPSPIRRRSCRARAPSGRCPWSSYSLRMNRMTCQCRSVSVVDPLDSARARGPCPRSTRSGCTKNPSSFTSTWCPAIVVVVIAPLLPSSLRAASPNRCRGCRVPAAARASRTTGTSASRDG